MFEGHQTIVLTLLLTAIFLYGWLEAAVYKKRDWACASWIMGLMMLTTRIIYPGSTLRVCLGTAVFASGMTLMVVWYRRHPPRP